MTIRVVLGEDNVLVREGVRALLNSRSSSGLFWDWPGDTEILLAPKPG